MNINRYTSRPDDLEEQLVRLVKKTEEKATADALAKARMEQFAAEKAAAAEQAAKDADWVVLFHEFSSKSIMPHEDVVTIINGMRNKGFEIGQVRELLTVWEEAEKRKAFMKEQEEALLIPKPEAFGSWA